MIGVTETICQGLLAASVPRASSEFGTLAKRVGTMTQRFPVAVHILFVYEHVDVLRLQPWLLRHIRRSIYTNCIGCADEAS